MLDDDTVDQLFARLAAAAPDAGRRPAKAARDPFRSLVSVMLSAQSRDANTEAAARALFALAATPEGILALPSETIARAIKPCGLDRLKARNLHAMCRALLDRFGGRVPATRTELMSLPGVGRKSADIILRFVHGEPVVAVDTHVARVSRRLGLAQGRSEAQLAAALEPRIPPRWRMGAHLWLLEHGKAWCKPRRPRCDRCPLGDLCERQGVTDPQQHNMNDR
jgi:endonuclease-3